MLCEVDTVSVEVELGPTVAGRDAEGPCRTTGEMLAARFTFMLKPFVPVTVIVKAVEEPLETVRDAGLAEMVKSGDGVVLKVAACRFSGLVVEASTIVTQAPSLLVAVQPV